MRIMLKASRHFPLIAIAMLAFSGVVAAAQVQTTTQTTPGQPTTQATVERGEVVLVEGNDLFVKMEDGQIRHFPNVPETARATVDGQELGIHDLKPGMKLQRTISVTTTPTVVTTVQTVTGKVWSVNPPTTVILTLENGKNQQFTVPEGTKFNINGEEKTVFDLRKGMQVSVAKVTETPGTEVTKQTQVTGSMPPPQLSLPPTIPVLIVPVQVATAPQPAEEPSAEKALPQGDQPERTPSQPALPKTGSPLPLLGLVGVLLTSVALVSLKRRHP